MKTIYNVYVPIESQPQADRMKQICIDYGLPYWDDDCAFKYTVKLYPKCFFEYNKKEKEFYISNPYHLKPNNKTQVTESEFLELVKINFANSK